MIHNIYSLWMLINKKSLILHLYTISFAFSKASIQLLRTYSWHLKSWPAFEDSQINKSFVFRQAGPTISVSINCSSSFFSIFFNNIHKVQTNPFPFHYASWPHNTKECVTKEFLYRAMSTHEIFLGLNPNVWSRPL